ncbi:MAG: winged helix-turn-helix domain-containing protein, partial [Acidimicrobiia bacterium]|nr:winged helix-turn-helix domain-containing protein [Acidimicrobiia bacterium]
TTAAPLLVELLGHWRATTADGSIGPGDWKSKKAFEVLSVLAIASPSGRSREQVIEEIWPARDPDKGRTLLRTALSEIRRVLEPGRQRGEASRHVEAVGDRVVVRAETDVEAARGALANGDHQAAFTALARGLAPDCPEADWVDEQRSTVARLTLEAAEQVAASSGPSQIAALEALVAAEPWSKDHVDALAAAHRTAGNAAAANAVERRWFEDD